VKVEDIMLQSDENGGLIVIREGKDEHFIKRTQRNSQRVSSVWARTLECFRDEIIELKGLAKKKGKG
jgi:hypothetical protein